MEISALRVAIVGMGFIGMQHIDAIMRQPGANVIAVADSRIEDCEEHCDQYGIQGRYRDYREMMDKEKPHIIHNCTPNMLHLDVSQAAFERGIHVYGEKPLAGSLEEGEALCRMAEKSGLANGINLNYRNNVMVWEIRERVVNGDAGRCFLIHGTYLQDWLMKETDFSWRLTEADNSSRALADIGSHWFDLVQFITGDKITAVNASLMVAHPTRYRAGASSQVPAPVKINSEDAAFVQLKMSSGLLASAVISQVSGGYKNAITLSVDCESYSMRWNQQSADRLVIGRKESGEETLFADPSMLSANVRHLAPLPAGHSVAWPDALKNSIGMFYEAVRTGSYKNGNTTYPTFADGLQLMRVVEACLISNRNAEWTTVL